MLHRNYDYRCGRSYQRIVHRDPHVADSGTAGSFSIFLQRWWNDWSKWIAEFGDTHVTAREPGAGGLKIIEDAPGSYVRLRLA